MTRAFLILSLIVLVLGTCAVAGIFWLTKAEHRINLLDQKAANLLARGDVSQAIDIWQKLHEQRPGDVNFLNRLGIACTKTKNFSEAESFFAQAMDIDPSEPQAYFNLGLLRIHQGRMKEAEEILLKLLTITDKYPETNYHLGYICEKTGRLAQAQDYYVREFNVNGNSAKAWRRYLALKQDEPRATEGRNELSPTRGAGDDDVRERAGGL